MKTFFKFSLITLFLGIAFVFLSAHEANAQSCIGSHVFNWTQYSCSYDNGTNTFKCVSNTNASSNQTCKGGACEACVNETNAKCTGGATGCTIGNISTCNDADCGVPATPPPACSGSNIFCGGCINACRANTQTCAQWINAECSGPGPTSPPAPGSCDGCTDAGSCSGKGGSWSASSGSNHPECAAQGGYCSGTTNCGGPPGTPPPGNLSCGQACTSSSQCRNPSAAGLPVACVAGTCQNTLCPLNQTIPGANCNCGANNRMCGQTCGAANGLCAPGQGACTYVDAGPNCPWGYNNFYCTGTQNGYTKPFCTSGDTGGQYLVTPSGQNTGITQAQMFESCQVCGDGYKVGTEQCDDGVLNGTASSTCTTSCQILSLVFTANGSSNTITVPSGSNVTLDWRSLGLTALTATDGWSGSKSSSGTEVVSNLTSNTTFTITGTQTGTGIPVSASVTVNIVGLPTGPDITMSVNKINAPVVYVKPVDWTTQFGVTNATFRWSVTNAVSCVGSTLEGDWQVYPYPGAWPFTYGPLTAAWFLWDWPKPLVSPVNGGSTTVASAPWIGYGTFRLTCVGPTGITAYKQIFVSSKTPPGGPGGPGGPGQCGLPDPADPAPPVCALNPPTQNGSITWTWPAVANADQYSIQIVDATTGAVVPVAGMPVGFVNGQTNFGCRPNRTPADNCNYTTILPPGSYRSKIQAQSSTNACTISGVATFPAVGLPGVVVDLCPAVAWWQSGNGSIFTQGNIQSIIPASCNPPTCIDSLIQDGNGIPGIAIGGSSAAVQIGTGTISSKDWLAKSPINGRIPDYDSFVSLIPVSITPSDTGGICAGGTFNSGGATTGNGYYWYRHNGDVTISSDVNLNAGRKVILFVDGNLTINGKISYNPANSYFMPIVKGNITIGSTVTTPKGTPTLTGIFYCDGKFDSGVGTGPLSVLGSVVAKNGVSLQRDLGPGNNFESSENFTISPDLMLNYPGELSFKRPIWKEVAP